MRTCILALLALLSVVPAAYAQEAAPHNTDEQRPTMQQRLLPENAAVLLAPAPADLNKKQESLAAPPANMAAPGSGTGLMIAGAALFVAGLIVGDDAGTLLAVTGAAIGAYGLYLYFR